MVSQTSTIAILEDDTVRISHFRARFPDAFITSDPNEFINFMKTHHHFVNLISLDHDLNFFEFTPYKTEITGFHVAETICNIENVSLDMRIVIHSLNPVGAKRMKECFLDKGFIEVKQWPFPWC